MTVYFEGPGATLIHGDATRLTEYIEPESVDLIVTSPPYFALRSYTDGGEHYDGQIGSEETPEQFLEALWTVTEQCARVLKPSGSMFINLGDKYAGSGGNNQSNIDGEDRGPAAYNKNASVRSKSLMGLPWRYALGCIDGRAGDPLILRAEIIWHKLNGLPESATDRVRRNHEQWFHFTKEPQYFSGVDEIREEHTTPLHTPGQNKITKDRNDADRNERVFGHSLGKLPGSVWPMAMEPLRVPEWLGVDHFAAFPTEWPRRFVLGFSPNGVCIECGEGQRPVVEKERVVDYSWADKHRGPGAVDNNPQSSANSGAFGSYISSSATITGYACACDNTKAPTRPAVVLDPFGGTGTVAMIARALGRHGIHVDLSRDYLKLAKWRVFESGHWAKAVRKTNEDQQQTLEL